MKATTSLAVVLSFVLYGCQPNSPGEPAPAPVAAAAVSESPVSPAPESASSADAGNSSMANEVGPATFLGYGDMRLGSSAAEMRQAWGGELAGSATEPQGCHYLTPKSVANSGELGFMVEGDRFVRYDVGTPRETAPGGGKVGMTAQKLEALYGKMETFPHKYVEGGRYLSPSAGGTTLARLVFEADASGNVTSWRVGLPPQVDYVEGCS